MVTLLAEVRRLSAGRVAALVALMVATALTEGIGMAALLPLLMELSTGALSGDSAIARAFAGALSALHLPAEPWAIGLLAAAIFVAQYALLVAQSWVLARLLADYMYGLRNRVFAALINARWGFFVKHKDAEMNTAVLYESSKSFAAVGGLFQLTANAISASIYLALSFVLFWKLSLAMLAVAGLIAVATRGFVARGRQVGEEGTRWGEALVGWTGEVFGGAKLVKATGAEEFALQQFSAVNLHLHRFLEWTNFQPGLLRAILELTAVSCLLLALLASRGLLPVDLPTLLVVLGVFVRLFPRLSILQQNLQALVVNLPAVEYIRALEAEAGAVAEPAESGAAPIDLPQPLALALRGVTVRYGEAAALSDVSMDIEGGAVTAVVGSSGAGKTTLLDCLLDLVSPDAGQILVGGVDLKSLPVRAWRAQIGYVGQETILFNASIERNLAWNRAADHETVREASRQANADEFIARLPAGYETEVGDRGVRLSGGQRQRLGLARALVGGRRLLVLDEATSALDAASEQEVLAAIARLEGRVTVVMVAHRLATIRGARHIYLLEHGRLVEHGTWDQLIEARGRFHAMWTLQNLGEASA